MDWIQWQSPGDFLKKGKKSVLNINVEAECVTKIWNYGKCWIFKNKITVNAVNIMQFKRERERQMNKWMSQ